MSVTTAAASAGETVVYYNHTGEIGGAEIALLAILRGLNQAAFSAILVSPQGELASRVYELGVPHVRVDAVSASFAAKPIAMLRSTWNAARMLSRLRREFLGLKPSMVHANSIRAGLIATLALTGSGVPVLWHLHDILPDHWLSTWIRRFANKSKAVHLVAVSHATAAGFAAACSGEQQVLKPIHVIYNSVDLAVFHPDLTARGRLRDRFEVPNEAIVFACVAQMTPRKRQLDIVRAFHAAAERMPKAHLLLAGAAGFNEANRLYAADVAEAVREINSPRIHLAGQWNDVAGLLAGVDAAVQFPVREPFGLSLLEAMAVGLPVVSSGVDGVLEVVENGVTGLLSEGDDVGGFMRNIEALARDPDLRLRLGAAGRAVAETKFTPSLQMQAVHSLYGDVIAAKRAGAV